MLPRVSIIILNYNGWKDTIECLESLYKITYPNYDVIVVDNGSNDDSVRKIKEYAKGKIKIDSKFFKYDPRNKPVKVFEIYENEAKQGKFSKTRYERLSPNRRMILIKNENNYGFTGGNNIGINFASKAFYPEYVLLLNNDTVATKSLVETLVSEAKREHYMITQPKIIHYDDLTLSNAGGTLTYSVGLSREGVVRKNYLSMILITSKTSSFTLAALVCS